MPLIDGVGVAVFVVAAKHVAMRDVAPWGRGWGACWRWRWRVVAVRGIAVVGARWRAFGAFPAFGVLTGAVRGFDRALECCACGFGRSLRGFLLLALVFEGERAIGLGAFSGDFSGALLRQNL